MSKTISSVPDFITREQYTAMFEAMGVDPSNTIELRAAHDGVHALVIALDENGDRITDRDRGYVKHRIFIPVRDAGDRRTARIRPVRRDL